MADARPQSYATHRRFVPPYHFFLVPLVVVLLGWAVWRLVAGFSAEAVFDLLLVVALGLAVAYLRFFPLRVQDRLIRLEMRLRLAEVLPADLAARVPELSTQQLLALRFASDEELPELTRRCLDGGLRRGDEIKRQVRTWVPDHRRM